MPSRDQAQLILEVDARVASAQRAINELARSIQSNTTGIERSLGKVAQAHERLGKTLTSSNGRIRSGFTQLSFQIGDVTQGLAMGTRASTIFAQQSGQVIQALQLMGGEGNKFLRFLGGPWGIALSTATVVLGTLIPKLFEGRGAIGSLVEKMREQADQAAKNKQADDIWKNTIEGLTEAMRKRTAEQEKSRQSDVGGELESFRQAEREIGGLARGLDQKSAELRKAVATVLLLRKELTTGDADPAQVATRAAALADAEAVVRRLRREVQELAKDVQRAERGLRGEQAKLLTREGQGLVDPVKAQTDAINFEIERLNESFAKGEIGPRKFRSEIVRLEKALKALKDASKDAGRALTDFISPVEGPIRGRFGEKRPGGQHQGIDIAVPVGTPVKAPAGGVVIEAGTLPGYGNVVFIDHGGGTITRLAHLSKIGVAKGQQLSQGDIVGLSGGARGAPGAGNSQGPHVHQEVRVVGRAVDPLTGKFATDEATASLRGQRLTETAAEKAIRQQNAFEEQRDRLNEELLRAQTDLISGIDEEADAAIAMARIAQERRDAAIQNDVEEGKISQAQADELKALNAAVSYRKMKGIELARQLRHMERQSELEQRQFEYSLDDLRFADEMARTAAEQRALQLQILDVVYQQKEAALRDLKARLEVAGKLKEAADVQAQIDRLPTEKAQDTHRTLRGTMNPLEAWADTVPQDAAEVTEALQGILANGLDPLANAITEVIMGTRSLGEAFSEVARSIIADIIQMTIRMLIFRAISAAMGGLFGGGSGASVGIDPVTGQDFLFSAKGNVFSGGNLVPFARGGVVGMPTLFPMNGGRTGLMGEAGPEAIMPLARDSMGRLGVRAAQAAANNTPQQVELIIHSGPSPEAWATVKAISVGSVREAAPQFVRLAVNQTTRVLTRPRLNGR